MEKHPATEHHTRAIEQHLAAIMQHHLSVMHHERGDHEKGKAHAKNAVDCCAKAAEASGTACEHSRHGHEAGAHK